jgi:hypothetical protein
MKRFTAANGVALMVVASSAGGAGGLACGTDPSETTGQMAERLTPMVHLVPSYDIGGNAVTAGDDSGFYANVDDGVSFAAADDGATVVQNPRRRSSANFTVALGGDPNGATNLQVNVRASTTSVGGGSVSVVVYDGDTVIATGPSHVVDRNWQNITDSFSDLSIATGHEVRVKVILKRVGSIGSTRVTALWADASHPTSTPAPTPTPTPTPSPTPSPPPPSSGTCTLHTDQQTHSVPPLAKPGYLSSVIDPVFGTKITRITGDPGTTVPVVGGTWGTRERHHYSKDQAWNADMSILYLEERGGGPQLFLDGHTYQVLFSYVEESQDAARWHPRDPHIMFYVGDHDLRTLDVSTGARTTIATFSGYSDFTIGEAEGNLSVDGTKIALTGTSPTGQKVTFAYDIAAKHKYPDVVMPSNQEGSATVSPKGDYLLVGYADGMTAVRDLQGNLLQDWNEGGLPDHYDVAIDTDGSEVAVGSARTEQYMGQIVKRRLSDGVVTLLEHGGYGSHTSTRNLGRPGWAYLSFFQSDENPPYSQEVAAVKLDGSGVVERLVQHRSTEDVHDYYAEAQPSPSPDGSKVIFASDWGDATGPIQAYVVDLPDVASGACK